MKKILITGGSRGLGLELTKHLSKTVDYVVGTNSQNCDFLNNDAAEILFNKYKNCNILINNAGICNHFLFNDNLNKIDDIFKINTITPIKLSVLFCKEWIKNNTKGKIINISSRVAKKGCAESPHYAASKAALSSWTNSFAIQMIEHGIEIFGLAPSWIETDMLLNNTKNIEDEKQKLPIKRFLTVKEICPYVDFLLNNDCSYMTGQVLQINGASYF